MPISCASSFKQSFASCLESNSTTFPEEAVVLKELRCVIAFEFLSSGVLEPTGFEAPAITHADGIRRGIATISQKIE
jgi:hypothetical protein